MTRYSPAGNARLPFHPPAARASLRWALLAGFAGLAGYGTAQAQSMLTIYGIVDQGLARANGGTTPGLLLSGRGVTPRVWTLKAGNTSRLGFSAREDLGDGLYSRFQLEHRFAADTGAPSNANVFWLGRSVVALGSKGWGEVYAGREYSAAYTVALNADPTYWSYVSQLGAAYTYANYTPVASTVEASNIRWANTVGYKSPTVAGVSAEIAAALGEGTRSNATSGNLQYKNGPVWLGAAFDRAKGGLNGDATAYSVSVLVPLSFGRTYAMFGRLNPATNLDSQMIGLGLQYDLSKRTLLYTNLGTAKRDGLTRTTAIDFGVKHTF
jgi:predicted porin